MRWIGRAIGWGEHRRYLGTKALMQKSLDQKKKINVRDLQAPEFQIL